MAVLTAKYVEVAYYEGYSGLFNNELTIEQPPGDVRAVEESDFKLIGGEYTYVGNVVVPAKRVLDVHFLEGWFEQYYNRIVITPNAIDVGTLVDSVTETFYIWNAYLTTIKTLSAITSSGVGGITSGVTPPVTFNPHQEREYDLEINLSGPVIIDAKYGFVFSTEIPVLAITGQRLLVWMNRPKVKQISETMEWSTDVIRAWDAEQRIAIRTRPRTILKYTYILNAQEYSKMKNAAIKWNANTFGVPIWPEFYLYGAISSNLYSLTFDTTPYEYYVGGMVHIWESDTNNQTLEITAVDSASISFGYPTNAFVNARVMPLKKGIATQGTKFKRLDHINIEAISQFLIVNDNLIDTPVGDGLDYPQYLSADVITSKQVIVNEFTEQIKYGLDFFDNGAGIVQIEKQYDSPDYTQQISFTGRTAIERWNNKVWFYGRYGKQKSFWVLSWSKDIEATEQIVTSAQTIKCQNINYNLYRETSYIAIILTNGVILFNTVTSGTFVDENNEVLSLENILPYDIDLNEIERICFMKKMRFDSDTIVLNYENFPYCTTKIPVMGVPV